MRLFVRFHGILMGFNEILMGFNEISWVLMRFHGIFMGFNGMLMGFLQKLMGFSRDLPSGKRLHSELERSTMLFITGKTSTIATGPYFQ